MRTIFSFIVHLFSTALTLLTLGSFAAVFFIFFYGKDLPNYRQLANYYPPTTTRIYAADGRLMEEYAKEKRIFVPIEAMPQQLIEAFLAAEDRSFYEHPGINPLSIARALSQNALNVLRGRSLIGGSTITQQVAKNFLLSSRKSLGRKIKEAILAVRMNAAFSKDRILELYLNEIYLGRGSYGVASAALNYFNKSIEELTLEEAALLAALPKAPSNYDPEKQYKKAITRRNWVISGMAEVGFITNFEAERAKQNPITLRKRNKIEVAEAEYFAEEVRRSLVKKYGSEMLYEGGLFVRTTMQPALQNLAKRTLKQGLINYDQKHGYRGPLINLKLGKNQRNNDWQDKLKQIASPKNIGGWQLAIVLSVSKDTADIGLVNGKKVKLRPDDIKWTGKESIAELIKTGDVIIVEKKRARGKDTYSLRQIPEVEGAIVALEPYSGRILAMVGGYSYKSSQFNRVTQAERQPGSAFKPFVYLAALEDGFTPASLIDDAPIELDQGEGLPKWSPQNYSEIYYGLSTLRTGIEKSRNVMSVRLAILLGLDKVVEVANRFGISNKAKPLFSTVLGSLETSLLKVTAAYCMLANGGKYIEPHLIEKIQDKTGNTVFNLDKRECQNCKVKSILELAVSNAPPVLKSEKQSLTDERSAFQIVSMLEGVVKRGTAYKARSVNKVLAGKTGTTNNSNDAWFVGFSPELAVGVYVGYDQPRSLGEKETGASVALPIFIDFMKEALKDRPSIPFNVPEGISMVKIDKHTGMLPNTQTESQNIIFEAFKTENIPTESSLVNPETDDENKVPDVEQFDTEGVY